MHKFVFVMVWMGLLFTNHLNVEQHAYSQSPLPSGQKGDWVLLFSDEFEGNSLDTSKWTTCYWWDEGGCTNEGNSELQWYLPQNVTVRDGMLVLQARQETIVGTDGVTYPYSSGMVTTGAEEWNEHEIAPARFTFRYGYVEVRAKVPVGQGLWSAIWMMPHTYHYIPEIDIMELLGHDPTSIFTSVHYGEADKASLTVKHNVLDFSEEWHVFAVDWQPDAITWYVDGVLLMQFTEMDKVEPQDMYLLMNLAVGGDWAGAPDKQTLFPAEFQVDYVRVWQRGRQRQLDNIGSLR